MTNQPRPRTQITDPIGQAVAANVRRVRERRGLSTYDLSRMLGRAGRPIAPSALAKVERGERRVDVGDLVALAVVLGVSPSALLLPLDDDPAHTIEVTGAGSLPADVAWDWMDGKRPLKWRQEPVGDHTEALEYDLHSRPPRRRRSWSAMQDLITSARGPVAEVVDQLRHEEPQEGDDG